MSPAIEITDLVKKYGHHRALDGVNLHVEQGSVFGFLGANGAGKTTALRILLNLARPSSGSVRVLGHLPGSPQVHKHLGYCPDVPGFLPWMTAKDVLESSANLFRLPSRLTRQRVGELLELSGLTGVSSRVSGYSRGMRQRLGIAQALINSPKLLLLDEPTSALDPMGRRMVLELLGQLRGKTTVFFSTHLLPDVERVCDSIGIIDAGRIVAAGPLSEVRGNRVALRNRISIEVDSPDVLQRILAPLDWVLETTQSTTGESLLITVNSQDQAALELPAHIAAHGLRLHRYEPLEPSLEDIFVDLIGAAS